MDDLKGDIERYRKGELTPAERHALEKKALSDPFLADALEGAESIDTNTFSSDILELQSRLDAKQKVRSWFSPVRIAASIGLLVIGTFIIYTFLRPPETLTLANKQVKTPAPPEAGQNQIKDSIVIVPKKEPKQNLLSLNKPSPTSSHAAGKLNPLAVEKSAGPELVEGSATINPSIQADVSRDSGIVSAPKVEEQIVNKAKGKDNEALTPESFKLPSPSEARSRKTQTYAAASGSDALKKLPALTIRGKVTSASDHSPIAGANVIIKGTETGTVTDAEGNYQITLATSTQALVFSFIGYSTVEENAEGKSNVNVQLPTDISSLSEVVVTGYGLAKDEDANENLTAQLAEPVGGRKSFDLYLREHLRYPPEAINQKVQGKVTVEFTVKSDGTFSDFKVVLGIGAGCNEELIRLIKEGPAWLPNRLNNTPRDSKVRVQLKFSVPR